MSNHTVPANAEGLPETNEASDQTRRHLDRLRGLTNASKYLAMMLDMEKRDSDVDLEVSATFVDALTSLIYSAHQEVEDLAKAIENLTREGVGQ